MVRKLLEQSLKPTDQPQPNTSNAPPSDPDVMQKWLEQISESLGQPQPNNSNAPRSNQDVIQNFQKWFEQASKPFGQLFEQSRQPLENLAAGAGEFIRQLLDGGRQKFEDFGKTTLKILDLEKQHLTDIFQEIGKLGNRLFFGDAKEQTPPVKDYSLEEALRKMVEVNKRNEKALSEEDDQKHKEGLQNTFNRGFSDIYQNYLNGLDAGKEKKKDETPVKNSTPESSLPETKPTEVFMNLYICIIYI